MYKTLVIIALGFGLLVTKTAESQSIDSSLMDTYTAYDSAKSYSQLLTASNEFKLIARQSPKNWLCNYYAAWSIAIFSFQEPKQDNKDPLLDEADAFFKKIESMDTVNDEVAVLGGLLAQARLSVSPMSRHGKYGDIANKYYDLARKVNPNNPRMYYLMGNSLFYTPTLFGGGPEKALPLYEKAESLFANDGRDIYKPHWGKVVNESMIKQCKDKIGK